MADGVLFLGSHLGKGLAQLGNEEHRVVPEAPVAHGGVGNGAVAIALRRQLRAVGKNAHHGGVEVGSTGHGATHILQQQAIAGGIIVQAAVAGGIDPRCAVQRVHAQAGIIADGRQAAGLHDGTGLDTGVFGEGPTVFLRLQREPQVGLEHDLHAQLPQNGLHFRQFSLVMGCQYKFHSAASFRLSRRRLRSVSKISVMTISRSAA